MWSAVRSDVVQASQFSTAADALGYINAVQEPCQSGIWTIRHRSGMQYHTTLAGSHLVVSFPYRLEFRWAQRSGGWSEWKQEVFPDEDWHELTPKDTFATWTAAAEYARPHGHESRQYRVVGLDGSTRGVENVAPSPPVRSPRWELRNVGGALTGGHLSPEAAVASFVNYVPHFAPYTVRCGTTTLDVQLIPSQTRSGWTGVLTGSPEAAGAAGSVYYAVYYKIPSPDSGCSHIWSLEGFGGGRSNRFATVGDAVRFARQELSFRNYRVAYAVFAVTGDSPPNSYGAGDLPPVSGPFYRPDGSVPRDPTREFAGPEDTFLLLPGPPDSATSETPPLALPPPEPTPAPQEDIMPTEPTPTPDFPADAPLASVSIKRNPADGNRLYLYVDARRLHRLLDDIGVPTQGTMYADRPSAACSVASGGFVLSTEVFLNKAYPAKYSLTAVFGTPPSAGQLNKLCQSSYEVIRKILEHYQPIDIVVRVQAAATGAAGKGAL